MILADKITELRKKAGWSQEELAAQLGVSRQSVSKWEGAQSVPDMEKILQLSNLFGVSTDYLLKDEITQPETKTASSITAQTAADYGETKPLRRVSMEEASEYIRLRKESALKIAVATFLCILSPAVLIMLGALIEKPDFALGENAAAGLGLCVLLVLVAIGVAIFISTASKVKEYEFLEKEPFETAYGVTGMVRSRLAEYKDEYTRLNIIGTVLCILSVVPLFICVCLNVSDTMYAAAVCLILLLVGIGCIAFVYGGTYNGALMKLLEEGDFTRENKRRSKVMSNVTVIYWLTVTAVFLFYTFGPSGNGHPQYSWIVWAIGGVLYGALVAAVKLFRR